MSDDRKRILIAIDWFLPGYRGGGPITSIANLIDGLSGRYHFSVLTSDRDYGQRTPYPDVPTDQWVERSPHCRVWYCSPEERSYRHFRRIIAETDYDLLYLNSMFSQRYTIYPLWNSRSTKPEVPVLLAPRGMLHSGALGLKSFKKKLFLGALKLTKIHKQIRFQATDAQEVLDIQQVFGVDAQVLQAPNLPKMQQPPLALIAKQPGELRIVFLSRLTEKKGLHYLLEVLRDHFAAAQAPSGSIRLDIIGPDEEAGYWERCAAIIATLPAHIQVQKHAPMPPAEAFAQLQTAHVFAMPTLGENFGHAIFEAFTAGRPVLISDKTPWRDLTAQQVGYDLPLDQPAAYAAALEQLLAMDQVTWDRWAQASWDYAAGYIAQADLVAAQVGLLEGAMGEMG